MLEDDYPYTSGDTGDASTECHYFASDATSVKADKITRLAYHSGIVIPAL